MSKLTNRPSRWRQEQLRGLVMKGKTWWLKRSSKGKAVKLENLKTHDLAEAIRRAAPVRAAWNSGEQFSGLDVEVLEDLAERIAEKRGYAAAKQFYDTATGKAQPIETILLQYAREVGATQGNLKDKRYAIAKSGVKFLEDVKTKKDAGAIVSRLLIDGDIGRSSISAVVRNLSAIWSWAESRGLVENNPWHKQRIIVPKTEKRALTKDELAELRPCVETSILRVLCLTGLRANELCALNIEDLQGDWIKVEKSKTNAGVRKVPITPALRKELKIIAGERTKGRLTPWKYGTVHKRCIKVLRETLGVVPVDLHSCRRTCATALDHSQVPEHVAAKYLGHAHKALSFGLYSSGASDDALRDAGKKVAAYMGLR